MMVELVTLKKVKCDLFHSYKKMSVTNSTPTIIMCDLFHFHKKIGVTNSTLTKFFVWPIPPLEKKLWSFPPLTKKVVIISTKGK